MKQTIIGIFQNNLEAETAKVALVQAGFGNERIRIADYAGDIEEPVTDGQLIDTAEIGFNMPGHRRNREAMISIDVLSSDKMKIATDILYIHGAVDVNEFVKPES